MAASLTPEDMRNVKTLQRSLRDFASSSHTFQVLRSLPQPAPKPPNPPKALYVLDSSFNPPTRAHLRICSSALLEDNPHAVPKRLLLLLATQNADKAPKPAVLEQRLAMMSIFAEQLFRDVTASGSGEFGKGNLMVDIGVTKEARFIDKAKVLEEEASYQENGTPVEQIHLTGYDTLIRLLDTKYYPPEHTLQPLEGLFEKHRVRVTRRTGDSWGGRVEQDEYMRGFERGEKEADGGKREWTQRIELVEGRQEGDAVVSSTKVREAAKRKDEEALKNLVTDGVARWIMDEKLYLDEG
ncbi:nicotinamide-nucleotide adenylyltransferase, partial [Lecanoromycetidae sp. Uapishka_2]